MSKSKEIVVRRVQNSIILEECGNCGRPIGKLETAHVHRGHVVCEPCKHILTIPVAAPAPPQQAPTVFMQQAPTVKVTNVIHQQQRRWSRGTAGLLSLLIPGLGQAYKGQIINAAAWFALVVVGYVCFILPGVALHLCCVLGAMSGDTHRR